MGDLKIIVAAHKPYWMPEDPCYLPVQVGAAGKESIPGFQRDDEGDNISAKNPHYCELTGLYWAWKNLDADYLGLAHYRRQFSGSGERGVMRCDEAVALLQQSSVVLPHERNYVIETVGDHYRHTLESSHVDLLLECVASLSPKYVPALHRRLSGTRAHMFNMFLMRRSVSDDYCSWLFTVLDMIERELDYDDMTPFQARAVGRLSEYLLDTWLDTEGVNHLEVSVRDMEPVNWVKKGSSFLAAKFLGHKYEGSF